MRPTAQSEVLLRQHLTLAYNLVGRAVDSAPLVLSALRFTATEMASESSPGEFRAALVPAATRALRSVDRSLHDPVSAFTRFTDRSIVQLGLSGQRREAVEATRWIIDDRESLSLWWLEVAGKLTRTEVAAALGVSAASAAIVVQQAEARFEDARTVVRVLGSSPDCPGLGDALALWDGQPSDRCRRHIARHVMGCSVCRHRSSDLIPADRLLRGFPLVPTPDWLITTLGLTPGALGIALPSRRALEAAVAGLAALPAPARESGSGVLVPTTPSMSAATDADAASAEPSAMGLGDRLRGSLVWLPPAGTLRMAAAGVVTVALTGGLLALVQGADEPIPTIETAVGHASATAEATTPNLRLVGLTGASGASPTPTVAAPRAEPRRAEPRQAEAEPRRAESEHRREGTHHHRERSGGKHRYHRHRHGGGRHHR